MRYEYLAIIGAFGFICLILNKLSSIATSLKNIDRCANHLSMQVGVVNERLHDIRLLIDDCKWDLGKIKDAADGFQHYSHDYHPPK